MRAARPLAQPPAGSGLRPVMGDVGPPVVGHSFRLLSDPLTWARGRYQEYGAVSWARALGKRVVGLSGPEAIEVALENRDRSFSQLGWEYFIGPFFHRGLMLMDFEEHRHHRRIMQHAFARERLRGYLQAMTPGIGRGIGSWTDSDRFLVYPALKRLTLDLGTEVFVGTQLGERAEKINQAFIDTVRAGTAVVRFGVPGGRWHRGLVGRRLLEQFFRSELPAKRAGDGEDLFTALCRAESEEGYQFDDQDVVNHMIFLLMAAHDTSTTTMTTMTYYLAKHPAWQERLREESRALGKPAIDYDDLDRLPSMDLAMKEALRIVAPVPSLARKTVKDTEVLGHYLPAGTMIALGPYFNHLMEEYWPEPERFDPERFAERRREDKVHQYAWTPFGGGAHKCIGMHFGAMEVKAVMHQLLLRYRWTVDPGYGMPLDLVALPRPKDGLPVRLERIG